MNVGQLTFVLGVLNSLQQFMEIDTRNTQRPAQAKRDREELKQDVYIGFLTIAAKVDIVSNISKKIR